MIDFLKYFNNHYILFSLCIGLLVLIFAQSRLDKKNKKTLVMIVITILVLSICEYLETVFNQDRIKEENFFRYLFAVLSYILRPVVIVLFYHIRINKDSKVRYAIWSLAIINTIIFILALFAYKNPSMRFVFWYSESNNFHRGPLGYSAHITCGIYLVVFVIVSIIELIRKTKKEINIIIIITVSMAIFVQLLSMFLDTEAYTSEALAIGSALYFMYLTYDTAYNDAINYEREMQNKTTSLMLSQIQPHFIYNTLATIQVLCEIDPELAAKTIEDFSKYLRVNTDALSKTGPVSILSEVDHAKAYSKIEMLRFDNIKVIFEIEDDTFNLPVLTIQPMVENAIKYGVRARSEGIVLIKTYKEDNKHYLIIKDNGVGFDVDKIFKDEKNHVGIINVKTRILNMMHGTFDIESEINNGTTVTITIPEESE